MQPDTPPRRPNVLYALTILGQMGVTSALLLSVCGHRGESSRLRIGMDRAAQVALAIAPAVTVNLVAGPCGSCVIEVPLRSGVAPQPNVAATVNVDHLRRVVVAQIGGLHGP